MRVSNSMLSNNYLNNLNKNLQKMLEQQTQIATGKRITKLSDDPVGAIIGINAGVKLERIEQYQTNVSRAQTWNSMTESAVMELNDVVSSAYERAVSAANDSMTAEDKAAIAAEISQLRDHIVSIANDKTGNQYLFGGYNTSSAPFEVDAGTGHLFYNGIDMTNASDPLLIAEGTQVTEYEIAYGIDLEVSIPGTELLGTGDDNLYKIFDDFYNALMNDESATVLTDYIDKFQGAQQRLMNLESEIGGRTNRLELVDYRHEEDYLNYTELKSGIEDVDSAEALMKFSVTQSIYLASLNIASDIVSPTLVDYLD